MMQTTLTTMMQMKPKNKKPGASRTGGRRLKRQNSRLAWESRVTAPFIKLDLVIECRRLPKKDSFTHSDAFCYVWEVPSGYGIHHKKVSRLPMKQERELGRTEVVRESKNPRFKTTFRLEYRFQEQQTYVIRVYDEDLRFATDLKEHNFIGGAVFTLGELMGAGGSAIARPLHRGKSFVVLIGKEIVETREVLEFRFSGQDLGLLEKKAHKLAVTKEVVDRMQKVGEQMQKVNVAKYALDTLDKFNPYFRLEKLNKENQTWKIVWKSEVIKEDQNPTWAVARLPLLLLCDDDPSSPLKITVWIWNRFTPDELVGFVETTVNEVVQKCKRGIPVFNVMMERKKLFGGTKLKKAGILKGLKGTIVDIPSMLQYISGGCGVDLMVAVDCSTANGDFQDENGLHFRSSSWLNDYQAAIQKIGSIFDSFEARNDYTMWGYGAMIRGVPQQQLLMGDHLKDADDLLKAYDQTFGVGIESAGLEQGEDAELSQIIQSAMYRAIRLSNERQSYSTLVILTAGTISDLQDSIDSICAAAEDAPLSIVIIGVGGSNFEGIQRLTGDESGRLRHSNGVPITRDIVHFCTFAEVYGNATKCVSSALSCIPEQFVQHFLNAGIQPNPPLPVPDYARDEAFKRKRSNDGLSVPRTKSNGSSQ